MSLIAGDSGAAQVNPLIDTVTSASLTTTEIHNLIEILHQKLGTTPASPPQWTKVHYDSTFFTDDQWHSIMMHDMVPLQKSQKGDQVTILTKQLEESQAALKEGLLCSLLLVSGSNPIKVPALCSTLWLTRV